MKFNYFGNKDNCLTDKNTILKRNQLFTDGIIDDLITRESLIHLIIAHILVSLKYITFYNYTMVCKLCTKSYFIQNNICKAGKSI